MIRHTTALFTLTVALLLFAGTAAAERTVRVAGPATLELADENGQARASWTVEAPIKDVLRIGNTLYVACGPPGILIYDLSTLDMPTLVGRLGQGRNVVKLAHNGQALLAVTADYAALTFSLADPQKPQFEAPPPYGGPTSAPRPPTAPTPAYQAAAWAADMDRPPPRAPMESWARVTALRGGWIAVTAPASGQLQVGDRFIVRSQRRVRLSDPTSSHYVYGPANEAMGMFTVTRVSGNAASGELPRGTVARLGDLAEPTLAPMSAPLIGPKLYHGMGRFSGTLMPLIGIGTAQNSSPPTAGFAMLNQFTLEYYFRVPLKIGVQAAPLGFALASNPGLATELRALFSFATSYFEVGISPGVELHLLDQNRPLIGWMVRIGSLDGLNLILNNSYAIRTGVYTGNAGVFASMSGEINIPLAQRFTLHLTGGGASSYAYGTIGLKHYLRGGGGPGTLILTAGAGGAYFSDRCQASSDSTNYAQCQQSSSQGFGPALALGLDARF